MPSVRVVPPLKLLAPVRIWVKVPTLLRAIAPVIAPAKVLLTEPSRVSVAAEPVFVTTPPAPEMLARPETVSAKPLRSTVPAEPTVRRLVTAPSALARPWSSEPAETVVSPA